jgi:hypothetical protein
MAVDGPVVDIHLIVVSCIHQGVAAFHHSRPARERLQDEKLGDGERDQLVFPGAGMPLGVHTQLAAFQNLAVGFLLDDAHSRNERYDTILGFFKHVREDRNAPVRDQQRRDQQRSEGAKGDLVMRSSEALNSFPSPVRDEPLVSSGLAF